MSDRSTIWSLSSPGGRLFDDRRITFNMRSEGERADAVPTPNAVEPVAPYLTLPSVNDPDGVLYDYAAIASTPPPHVATVQALMRERQRDALRAAEEFRKDGGDPIDDMAAILLQEPAFIPELNRLTQDRLYGLTVIDESGDVTERVFRERVNQDRLHDLTGGYPFWTADDTSSCDDCPVRSYSDLDWRDQGDEREVL